MKKPAPFGKYYLLERISIGGMAEVFRAKAFGVEGFERLVAVKRILSNIAEDKEFIRMFIEEAKLAVQLNHANIAQIFDLGVVDGAYYIALEHVHGRDLRVLFERCRQVGEAMPVAQACFVAMKVCEGLDYAHNKRDQHGRELALVHRDVSPQNILVSFEGEVKLIDFGIAKAAGTGGSTQAGILKGKFGYMSPEQVRGQDVDRRSDVFSCGIVLYELLTGERLFVGESDFSTLEKVRNVEILPPSTYNRKIPDELERIVLKALSKDADDRYPNAIDLHDELQAFVYTAGEFYSRKDLAAWMKKTFGKEIEDETAKLESYRQLRPPPPVVAPSPPSDAVPEPVRASASQGASSSTASPSAAVPPPPSPPLSPLSSGVPQAPSPSQGSGGTGKAGAARKPTREVAVSRTASRSQPVATVKPPPPPVARSQPITVQPPVQAHAHAAVPPSAPPIPDKPRARRVDSGWDDDDVETRVYDGDDPRHKSNRSALPLQAPVSSSPGIPLPPTSGELVPAEPLRQPALAVPPVHHNGAPAAPAGFPVGSDNLSAPVLAEPQLPDLPLQALQALQASQASQASQAPQGPPGPQRREISAPHRVIARTFPAPDMPTIPVTRFGSRITDGRRMSDGARRLLMLGLGGVAVVVLVTILAVSMTSKPRPQPAPTPTVVKAPPPPPAPDPSTGFDLYVTPSGITQWKLDGEARTDRLPSRIRGIAPGPHTVQIEPPPGFLSEHQQVAVELGKAPKVEIALQPIPGISGTFDSTPPGATVSLIVDGKRQAVGPSPARAPLDPRSTYQVLFEKPGYVSVNRPITFTGALEERVSVNLEKVAEPAPAPAPPPRISPQAPAPRTPPPAERPRRPARPVPDKTDGAADPAATPDKADDAADRPADTRKQGVLVLGSKPPCDITIDGIATNLHTPQKEIKLSVGRHRVTLTNTEFGINETFTVDIKADAPERMIKDYSDRLPVDR